MKVAIALLLACALGVVAVLLALSPGTPARIMGRDGKALAGSLSEKLFVEINGVPQGMFIRGNDRTKPVLLFLHDGPAMPEFAISQNYPTVLEAQFVVCWWEQRGSGLSFRTDIARETLTEEQLVSDTIAVTNYLRARFAQDKIYLMAHSGGSFFGIQAAARAPELYHAYIGVAQISRQLESEKGEELGWQGYAYAKVKTATGSALLSALIIGAVWALWHVIPFAELGRSVDWIVWQSLGAVAMRIIIVWLVENAGQSVFIAVLFHTMINSPWGVVMAFESYYDPFVMFVILALVAGILVALWEPSTLTRFRFAEDRHAKDA